MDASDIANLPHELRVTEFSRLASTSPDTIRRMILDGTLRARQMRPGAARPTYLVPSEQLYGLLGISPQEEYVWSRLGRPK